MIDRLVEAIYREFEARPRYAQLQMNDLLARELVVAVLRAMRPQVFGDLPESVVQSGEQAIDQYGSVGNYSAAHAVFTAMIDALLTEAVASVPWRVELDPTPLSKAQESRLLELGHKLGWKSK